MSSNPSTSGDLLRYRHVLDETLVVDKLDSAQYRTRIRAMVVVTDKGDLYAPIRGLVPAARKPDFTDEGHEVPMAFSSVSASPILWPEEETTRAVRATGANAYAGPAPIDPFPSFPDDDPCIDEGDPFPDESHFRLGDEDSLPGEEGPYPDEEDSFPSVRAHHLGQDVSASVTQSSSKSLKVGGPMAYVVPVIQSEAPAGSVPGKLVPVRQWSAGMSPWEQAPASSEPSPRKQALTSSELSPRGQAPTSTELSPVGQRSAEISPLEPPPGTAFSPAKQDDDDSVNRVVVVMVPSASSSDELGVVRSVRDELLSPESPSPEPPLPEPKPVEPGPATPSPTDRALVEPKTENDEPVTRTSAPVGFDDPEAPTQALGAVKDPSIFRDETTEKISEPPQPVSPYSVNRGFFSTPADSMAQATTAPSTEYTVPPMPPPVPELSAEALTSMPPPVPPSANPPQDPWVPYERMSPSDPAATAPPSVNDSGYGAVSSAPYYRSPQPYDQYIPPPSVSYQLPAPVYGTGPTQDQIPKRHGTWARVMVTMMVLALLAWVAYPVIFRQDRHAAPEISLQIQVSAAVTASASPVTSGQQTQSQSVPQITSV